MEKSLLRMTQVACLAFMVISLQSASCENEKEEDESGLPYYTKFVDIQVVGCERVGSVLQVDLTVTNKQNGQVKVGLVDQKGSDNNGTNYSADIAAGSNKYGYRADLVIESKATQQLAVRILDFDPNNKASKAGLNMRIDIEGQTLADYTLSLKNLSFTDNRVMTNGVQTNDRALQYKVNSCAFVGSDVELKFTVTNNTGMALEDFGMGYMYGSGEAAVYDNQGTRYDDRSIKFGENDWYHNASGNLQAGATFEGTIIVRRVNVRAEQLSITIGVDADNYRMSDNKVRFISIPITR